MSTNWDDELKRIDRQLAELSDEKLLAAAEASPAAKPAAPAAPAAPAKGGARAAQPSAAPVSRPAPPASSRKTLAGIALRLTLVATLAGALVFWPYEARCGLGLAGYLAATGALVAGGVWSSVWSWRHRAPRAHVASLVLTLFGIALAGREVLPRVGYAQADPVRAGWSCAAVAPAPAPVQESPGAVPQGAVPQGGVGTPPVTTPSAGPVTSPQPVPGPAAAAVPNS